MAQQMQLCLFDEPPTVEALLRRREDQWFDRKSIRIEARDLANLLVGLANADGGRMVVGIHQGKVEGVNASPGRVNELQQAAIDFCSPPVRHAAFFVDCINNRGVADRLMILDVEASEQIHRNRKQECYLRVGDETRRLGPTEERELAFDKGESVFDSTIVPGLTRADLDEAAIAEYAGKIGASNVAAMLRSRGICLDAPHRTGVTQAGWLLFGKVTPIWSYVRYLRYAGSTVETGARSNVVEDIILEGAIPSLIEQARQLLLEKLDSVIRLAPSGRFERVPILPPFVWLEAIVNAVAHRSYSLQGDGVRVRDFDDRLEVESPGRLPGLVRVQNIRNCRFSRNPHIARVLAEMTGYVRELNEGVPRMFEEMEQYGLRPPVYSVTEGSVRVTLCKRPTERTRIDEQEIGVRLPSLVRTLGQERLMGLLTVLRERQGLGTHEIAALWGLSRPTVRKYMKQLEDEGLVRRVVKSSTDPTARWILMEDSFRTEG